MINFYLLTKPGIILGNLITVAAGFLLASKGVIDVGLFFQTLLGLALIMSSACVFNNYIDRHIDQKMERTKNRALAKGSINPMQALVFATIMGLIGNVILLAYTNLLTVAIADFGFFVYVVIYSSWKVHTIYGTAIGSISGAVPPVVGYCAVSNHFDAGALIFFLMLVLWQMPHFYSIAVYRLNDYRAAGIPVLPLKKGLFRTKIHMVIYIIAFIMISMLLTVFNYTGYIYLIAILAMGIMWLLLCIKGFFSNDDHAWARGMFRLSLFLITVVCFAIPLDITS